MTTLPLYERAIYSVPLIGWMLKDVVHGDRSNLWWFLFTLVSCWIMAIMTFGYPAVILPVVCAVPAMFVVLILITLG
jgi:hypothetical protein